MPFFTQTTTPVRAAATSTLPMTHPPPVSPCPSHLPPHPHSSPTPHPAPAAPILPPFATAAPISPATPITTHVSVDPYLLSMAPPPRVPLCENTPPAFPGDDTPPPDPRQPRPPGLLEMDGLEGVRLIHKVDGHICGRNPETHMVAKLLKFVKTEFKASEKICLLEEKT